jgi:hypothetical protein
MKAEIALSLILLACGVQAAPGPKPVVEYTFDACTGEDVTGNGNDATIGGTKRCAQGIMGNKAFVFDGVSNYLVAQDSQDFDAGSSVSYTFWVKPRGSGGAMFSKNVFAQEKQSLLMETSGLLTLILYPCVDPMLSTGAVPLNDWTFVAITFDGTTARIYFNAELDARQKGTSCNVSHSNGLFFLGRTADGGPYFDGLMDDFRLYQTALTAKQVSAIYEEISSPTIHGTAPWGTSHTVTCRNLTQGTSLTLPATKVPAWDCEAAGLRFDPGDEARVTIDGLRK